MKTISTWGTALLLLLAAGCGDECTDEPGRACVWAGTGELGFDGDGRHRRETRLYWPEDMEFAPDGTAWVLDWNNHRVRRVRLDGTFETLIGDFVGDGPFDQGDLKPPGSPGLEVNLNHPTDLQFLPDGRLIFAAWHNHKIRTYDPVNDRVLVACGRGSGYAGDGGPASAALFNQPKAIALDPEGALYVLDQRNFRVRRIAAGPDPVIETVAGTGEAGFSGDGDAATAAQLRFEAGGNPEPSGALALDRQGNLYIADGLNHRVRRVDRDGVITTIAGTGEAGFSGDGGPAIAARVNNVRDMELGPDGRLYLADSENHRIRAIDLRTGTIDTVAGSGAAGMIGVGPAREIQFDRPYGVAFDTAGDLYVSDTYNSRIIRVKR